MKPLKTTILCLAALVSACASTPPEHTPDFLKADTNHDGAVSLPEWLHFGGSEASYLAIDKERTGKLSETQFREALRMGTEVFHALDRVAAAGGFAPAGRCRRTV